MTRLGRGAREFPAVARRPPARVSTARLLTRREATVIIASLLVGLLGGCGPRRIPPDTGVRGDILIGPTCPVVRFGTECPDRPFQTLLEIQRPDGRVVAQVESNDVGRFQIALPPGDYILAPAPPNPGSPPYASPRPFTVTQGVWTTLTVQYDSGIR